MSWSYFCSNFSLEDVHVSVARQIARIAKQSGVERLIHVSALNVAEKPQGTILKGGSRFLSSKVGQCKSTRKLQCYRYR